MGMKKDMLQETEEQQLRWRGYVKQMEDCHRGTGGAAEQSVSGRMGLGTESKDVTLRMKNVSIPTSEGKILCLWIEKNCVFAEYSYIQRVPEGKANILGGHSIGHSKQKSVRVYVSYSEPLPRYSYFTQYFQRIF
jgi:hypothetical protein